MIKNVMLNLIVIYIVITIITDYLKIRELLILFLYDITNLGVNTLKNDLDYLINELIKEDNKLSNIEIPTNID